MARYQIQEVLIDGAGYLQVRPGRDYSFIWRDASGITWLPDTKMLAAREPHRWEALGLFSQIVQAVRNEYGDHLVAAAQTRWTNVPAELQAKILALATEAKGVA